MCVSEGLRRSEQTCHSACSLPVLFVTTYSPTENVPPSGGSDCDMIIGRYLKQRLYCRMLERARVAL